MSLTKLTANLNAHQNKPDKPSDTAEKLKQDFDKPVNDIKDYINNILTSEIDGKFATDEQNIATNTQNIATNTQNIATNTQNISDIQTNIADTGWQEATITNNNFKKYSDLDINSPKYRRIGNIVELRGVLQAVNKIPANASPTYFLTLPEGYRPSSNIFRICQGSSTNRWLLTIEHDGRVGISRYGTTSMIDIAVGAWLPFNEIFFSGGFSSSAENPLFA